MFRSVSSVHRKLQNVDISNICKLKLIRILQFQVCFWDVSFGLFVSFSGETLTMVFKFQKFLAWSIANLTIFPNDSNRKNKPDAQNRNPPTLKDKNILSIIWLNQYIKFEYFWNNNVRAKRCTFVLLFWYAFCQSIYKHFGKMSARWSKRAQASQELSERSAVNQSWKCYDQSVLVNFMKKEIFLLS